TYHDGGRIMFGPDGNLFAVVGEGHDSSNAQDLTNNAGKILRMNGSGQAPPDNPHPPSLSWSYGHRNSFGFTLGPITGNLGEPEGGADAGPQGHPVHHHRVHAHRRGGVDGGGCRPRPVLQRLQRDLQAGLRLTASWTIAPEVQPREGAGRCGSWSRSSMPWAI